MKKTMDGGARANKRAAPQTHIARETTPAASVTWAAPVPRFSAYTAALVLSTFWCIYLRHFCARALVLHHRAVLRVLWAARTKHISRNAKLFITVSCGNGRSFTAGSIMLPLA